MHVNMFNCCVLPDPGLDVCGVASIMQLAYNQFITDERPQHESMPQEISHFTVV